MVGRIESVFFFNRERGLQSPSLKKKGEVRVEQVEAEGRKGGVVKKKAR